MTEHPHEQEAERIEMACKRHIEGKAPGVPQYRGFLIGAGVTWTDVQRQKDNRVQRYYLEQEISEAKDPMLKTQLQENLDLLNNEIQAWQVI